MGLYDKFGTDATLEAADGVDLDFGGGVVVTIRRAGGANVAFESAAKRIFRPHRAAIDAGTLDKDEAARLLAKVYAEAVVIGWRGVTGPDGGAMPFTVENCVRVFTDLPEFFAAVKREAENAATFRRAELKADADALGNG